MEEIQRFSREVDLKTKDYIFICQKSKEILKEQPVLLNLEAPINICGDIHGQYYDLLRLFECGGYPPETRYLFLGDYVDRGKQSLETISLLLLYKIKYPNDFFILRGNHESSSVNKTYGFYDECKRRGNVKLWRLFSDVFNYLPVSALIENKIISMHGGLSMELEKVEQINNIVRPSEVPDSGILCDILWSDPSEENCTDWCPSDRGVSYSFSKDMVHKFLLENDLDLIVRAHQVVEEGYEFFADKKLVTVFSAPNYCGEFDNYGGMMRIEKDLECSFIILKQTNLIKHKKDRKKMKSAN